MTDIYKKIEKGIREYGLKPASRRDLPLLTLSVIADGYVNSLRKQLGISYGAVFGLGNKDSFHTLMNEAYVGSETGKALEKNFENMDEVFFKPAREILDNCEKRLERICKANNQPLKCLQEAVEIYLYYMVALAIYNGFWRYLGDEENKGKLSPEMIKKISSERDITAALYPKLEKVIAKNSSLIGKKEGFDGNLLRFFARTEIKEYFKKPKLTKIQLKELRKRQEKYFYFCTEGENNEYVTTDEKIIEKVYNNFFKAKDEKTKIIKGHIAYKGKAKGVVYNLQPYLKNRAKNKPAKDFVLVASMTHPKDLSLAKQCLAIVTDEGGILSHAAITARELKKPCIIATRIATQILKDGDLVEVDADKGMVRIINS
jgi:phosphoenolpyruvate synthase/pyruvate phosphate dikinase